MTLRVIASLREDQLCEGKPVPVIHPPTHIVAIRRGSKVFAMESVCTHEGASLMTGVVRGETIECRAHGYCFDLKTGRLLHPEDDCQQRVFPVERRGDHWVILEDDSHG